MPNLKPLSTLPRSNSAFRIDAIGNIQRNPRSPTNHLINILVSPITRAVNYKRIFDVSGVDNSQQQCYQFSAGEFFQFSPGSVIRDGRIIWTPNSPTIREVLNISQEKTQFISAGAPTNNNGRTHYLIPANIYKLGIAAGSQLLAIERDGDPYSILIPTMELLRFYYSGSSKLNQAIFSSKLTDLNELVNVKESHFDKSTRHLNICLRQDYPNEDAAMIGHWFCDRYAYKQVLNVWNALIKFQHNKQLAYLPLNIGFPFIGETTIAAQGIELPTPENYEKKRKLILTLMQCTHPRPFDSIIYTRDNEGGPGELDDINLHRDKTAGYRQRINTSIDDLDGVNDPFLNPSIDVQPDLIRISSYRFPPIKIQKKVKLHSTHNGANITQDSPVKLPNQSTSDSTSGTTDAAPISIVPSEFNSDTNDETENEHEHESLTADFDTFQKVIEALINHDSISSIEDIIIQPGKKASTQQISHFPTESGRRSIKWSLTVENGRTRPRQAILKKVSSEFGTHYLFEVERRKWMDKNSMVNADRKFATYVFSDKSCNEISSGVIEVLFQILAESGFKYYKKRFKILGLNVSAKNHAGTITERALMIVAKMKARWEQKMENISTLSSAQDDSAEADSIEVSP